mmetsp:Transcript_1994/g.5194  ORF Transcript_1994/g.5194 Transcript_1994/m.5194 type:complete len:219 (+) Transcript_1994:204-860(+)
MLRRTASWGGLAGRTCWRSATSQAARRSWIATRRSQTVRRTVRQTRPLAHRRALLGQRGCTSATPWAVGNSEFDVGWSNTHHHTICVHLNAKTLHLKRRARSMVSDASARRVSFVDYPICRGLLSQGSLCRIAGPTASKRISRLRGRTVCLVNWVPAIGCSPDLLDNDHAGRWCVTLSNGEGARCLFRRAICVVSTALSPSQQTRRLPSAGSFCSWPT